MIKATYKSLILFVISMLFINLSAIAIDNNSNPESTKPILKSIPNDYSKAANGQSSAKLCTSKPSL